MDMTKLLPGVYKDADHLGTDSFLSLQLDMDG